MVPHYSKVHQRRKNTHRHTETKHTLDLEIWQIEGSRFGSNKGSSADPLSPEIHTDSSNFDSQHKTNRKSDSGNWGVEEDRPSYRAIRAFTSEHIHFTQRLQQWLRVTSHLYGQADFVNTSGLNDMKRKPNKKRNKIKCHKQDHSQKLLKKNT